MSTPPDRQGSVRSRLAPVLVSGDRIADYEVVARLSSGGMATLYLARRDGAAGFSRHVAIKVINPDLAEDEEFVRMFIDEAKISARIHHPNVVHIEQLGEAQGRLFLAMEFVHGCSLSELIRALRRQGRRLSPELAIYIGIKVADGLHAAHETTDASGAPLGVVHRDVSPQNILLSYTGHVKLIDFGIAKARGRASQTLKGFFKGKLPYMSPEQAYGKSLDRRSDVYSLGVTLWGALTSERLFQADTEIALLELARAPTVKPPSTVASGVPLAVDAVIMAALAPDLNARIKDARELRRRLVAALPTAAGLDAYRLAELLRSVMSDRIRRDAMELPMSFSGVVEHPVSGDSTALEALTRSMSRFETPSAPAALPERTDLGATASGADTVLEKSDSMSGGHPMSVSTMRSGKNQRVAIHSEDDIAKARNVARKMCAELGFGRSTQVKVCTVASELARNIVCYAGHGVLHIRELDIPKGIELTARDEGPGIRDLDDILSGRYRSKSGLGKGLTGIRAIMDEFHVESELGRGTTVTAIKYVDSR